VVLGWPSARAWWLSVDVFELEDNMIRTPAPVERAPVAGACGCSAWPSGWRT